MFKYYVCEKCGKGYYPKKVRCRCGSTSFKEVIDENAEGKIYTYTIIYVPPKGFTPPIAVAIAEYNGMRFLGKYNGDPGKIKIGEKVRLDTSEDGSILISPIES
ncbi:OB-fold domain-containing protein [Fervidicoccus fontis]|nr:OB-fold domain-containing protein [Fervidicoccus fontis]MBE9391205.1 OB-fold domain-containing protein [Fervidicoccus fontis]